jgi:hypothetical protein
MRKTTYYLWWAGAGIFGAVVAVAMTQPKAPATSPTCRLHVLQWKAYQAAENLLEGSTLRAKLDHYNAALCEDVTLVYPNGKTELWRDIRMDIDPPSGFYR